MTFFRLIIFCLILAGPNMYSQIPEKLKHTNWKQEGYDRVLKIGDSTYTYYNANESGCSTLVQGNFEGRFEIIGEVENSLILNPGGVVNYRFQKIDTLPEICKTPNKDNFDFETNFKAFWRTFNDNYAFFQQRDLNWDEVYQEYLPRIRQLNSDDDFAKILQEIVQEFEDDHIRLEIPSSVLPDQNSAKQIADNKISKEQILKDISGNYLVDVQSYNNGVLRWGRIKDSELAYIAVTDMNNLANYVFDANQNSASFDSIFNHKQMQMEPLEYFNDEIAGTADIINTLQKDLEGTQATIIDLRFNGGGFETVALELLSHFVDSKREVFSVKAKTKNGFTPLQTYTLKPKAGDSKKVYLLTSPFTASAAEIFVLASMAYPNFERYGSRTAGIFSELLWKKLPNGWEYSLSNELYLDPNARTFEGKGIPVDYDLEYSEDRREFYSHFYSRQFADPGLEKIIENYSEQISD